MARITAFAAQKGGTGKTTITTSVAAVLAGPQYRRNVLLLDFDGQCHGTEAVLKRKGDERHIAAVFRAETTPLEAIVPSPHEGAEGRLWAIPGYRAMSTEFEIQLLQTPSFDAASFAMEAKEMLLDPNYGILGWRHPENGRPFDHILIDTPPALGLNTQLAYTLADGIVIVGTADHKGHDGAREAAQFVTSMAALNPSLVVDGVIINLFKTTRSDPREFVTRYEEDFGELLITPPLPDISQIGGAMDRLTPVEYLRMPGAKQAGELVRRLVTTLNERWARAEEGANALLAAMEAEGHGALGLTHDPSAMESLAARLPDAATQAALDSLSVPVLAEDPSAV